jgi:hypothetical protein
MLTENWCWKWNSATACGFLCAQECESHVLVIITRVKWASSVNRMSCRMCIRGYGHSQNCTWLVWCKTCYILWRWCRWKPSWCKILHTCVCATQIVLEIRCILVLGFTALLPEHHFLDATIVHLLYMLMGRNQSPSKFCVPFQTFCCVESCDVWSGHHCWYCTPAALPFPLQKPYMKCISTYSLFVNMLGILTKTPLQHNTKSR